MHTIENYYYNNHASYLRKRSFIFPDIDLDGDKDLLCTNHRISDLSWFENSFIDTIGYIPFPETNTVWTEQNTIFEGDFEPLTGLLGADRFVFDVIEP